MAFINVAIYVCLVFSLCEHVKILEFPFYSLLKFSKFFKNILPCFTENYWFIWCSYFFSGQKFLEVEVPKVKLLEINLFYWSYLKFLHPQFLSILINTKKYLKQIFNLFWLHGHTLLIRWVCPYNCYRMSVCIMLIDCIFLISTQANIQNKILVMLFCWYSAMLTMKLKHVVGLISLSKSGKELGIQFWFPEALLWFCAC